MFAEFNNHVDSMEHIADHILWQQVKLLRMSQQVSKIRLQKALYFNLNLTFGDKVSKFFLRWNEETTERWL